MNGELSGPANWRGAEMLASGEWIHRFSESEIAELEAALAFARARGRSYHDVTKEDFPLPTIAPLLESARAYLEDGAGLFLFRGIPVQRYPKKELRFLYWCLGKHMGTAVSQSNNGDALGDVRNIGEDIRIYTSKRDGPFHADGTDVVGLFVLRAAKSGGLSRIVSAVAVHNEIARTRPDLLELLYQPYSWSWLGMQPEGAGEAYHQPVFSVHQGKFSCTYIPAVIRYGHKLPGESPLTPRQDEALALIDRIANREDFHFSMMFEPGDLQFLNNHLCIHARSAFEDFADEDQRRHLLRMWLSVPNSRALSPSRAEFWDIRAGALRGGYARGKPQVYETAGELQT